MSEVLSDAPDARFRRFRPYPEYKDSGVEWLGEIPAHWEVKPFKALLARNDSGVWGEDFADDGVVVLRSTEQTVDGRWRIEDPARRRLTAREASESRLEVGDLVTTKSSGSDLHIGKTSIVDESVAALKCSFSNFMQRLRVAAPQEPRHYWYLLNCPVAREQLVFLSSTTTGLGNLNGSILGAIRIPVAPDDEQRTIAAFLDRETARIDAMVAKKERLIELLQEKRTALITWVVTKGLDPNVSMKESGVEWLGEIPAHWEAKRLVRLTDPAVPIVYGILLPGPRRDEGVPYIGAGDVAKGHLRIDALPRTTEEIASQYPRSRVRGGEIVYAIRGSFGAVEIVPSELTGVNLSRDAARVAPRQTVVGRWLCWALRSDTSQRQFDFHELGATITGVNIRDLKRVMLPCSPTVEQTAIADYLDRETAKIDALVAKVRDGIEHLKEFRTTLISAAVTGKIDVRDHVNPEGVAA